MAVFQSDVKETVCRLSAKDFASQEERDELLERLASATSSGCYSGLTAPCGTLP